MSPSDLKEIFNKYYGCTFAMAYALLENEEESQAVVVDVFTTLYNMGDNVQGDKNIQAFCLITARTLAVAQLKNNQYDTIQD